MGKIIGIDLGTTNSVVAVMEGGEPTVIANEDGGRTTPSVVAFEEDGNVLVGIQAKRQSTMNPESTVFSAKRFMGMRFSDAKDEVGRVPFKVVSAENGDTAFELRGKRYSPPEISARVLMRLKKAAEDYLGDTVTEAVITVPAYFNDAQRQATQDAGKIAGLKVRRIVNEPTAAALAYGLDNSSSDEQLLAVFDLGGGTFDISILEVGDNVVEVISTNGDTHLGGDDFDDVIVNWMKDEFRKETGVDLSKDARAMPRLRDEAEKAKVGLSSRKEVEISIPFLTQNKDGTPVHLQTKLTRAKFESMIADLVERTLDPCRKALSDAKKEAKDVDRVLLVGGSTRVPLVQQKVSEFFGRDPSKGVNPDEVVGLGAAVQGGVLSGDVNDLVLVDVTPLSLGIETLGGVMTPLISRNTTIPTNKSEVFTTAADQQSSVEVHVLQGERSMAKDNRTLGKFTLVGIPPAARGVPQIEVTFDIDANGIVSVSAQDKATGRKQQITISNSSGLSKDDIEKMVDEAKKHEAEDQDRRQAVEARNALEALVLQTEKNLQEFGHQISHDVRSEVESAVDEARDTLSSEDAERVNAAREKLVHAANKIGEQIYGQPGSDSAPDGEPEVSQEDAPPSDPAADDVIDADFEEKG